MKGQPLLLLLYPDPDKVHELENTQFTGRKLTLGAKRHQSTTKMKVLLEAVSQYQ